jgi:archaellum biogenesis ATPase FlaH
LNLTRQSQEILLANTLKNHPATVVLLSIISDKDWATPVLSEIWTVVKAHYLRYNSIPSRSTLIEELSPDALQMLTKLYTINDGDSVPALIDMAVSFVKYKRLQDLVRNVDDVLEQNPDLAEITLRNGLSGLPIPAYNSNALLDMLPNAIYNYDDNRLGLPTGISVLDRATKGGVGLGEVFIVAAPSGGGKSSLLSMICTNVAVMVPCLYITLELSADRVVRMLSARVARVRQSEITSDMQPEQFVQIRQRMQRLYPMEVAYYPSETLTVSQISGMVEYLRRVKGVNVQAIFIDYCDHLTTNRVAKNSPKWEKIAAIYQELVDLAKVSKVAIFTASQLKNSDAIRKGSAEAVEYGDIAGSIEKINKADVAIAWKPLEVNAGIAKGILSFMKVREGEQPNPWICSFDYDKLSFKFLNPFSPSSEAVMAGSSNNSILSRLA